MLAKPDEDNLNEGLSKIFLIYIEQMKFKSNSPKQNLKMLVLNTQLDKNKYFKEFHLQLNQVLKLLLLDNLVVENQLFYNFY